MAKIKKKVARKRPNKNYGPNTTTTTTTDNNNIKSSHGLLWVRGRILGRGSFGSVFLAKTRIPHNNSNATNNEDVEKNSTLPLYMAVKSAVMKEAESLKYEKDIIKDLSSLSPYFVRYYGDEVTITPDGEVYNILMEYCSEGSLYDRIRDFGIPQLGIGLLEREVKCYTRDVVTAISVMHRRGLIHCDIKPANVLIVRDGERLMAKLVDFGLAGRVDDKMEGMRGTHGYMSPELVCDKKLEYPVDIWALGCVVLEMLSGKPMWGSESLSAEDVLCKISHCPDVVELPPNLSGWAKDFLENCLVRDVDFRWTADELLDHPFLDIKK